MFKTIVLIFFLTPLFSQEKFDWGKVLHLPPGANEIDGNQILHFKSKNKPYWTDEKAAAFVSTYLQGALALTSDAEVLRFASDHVTLQGSFLELGVCTGKTINFIAALNPHETIYGFDSFEGLPEDWVREDLTMKKGTFGFKDPRDLPPVLHNVVLIKGWLSDTLPRFSTEKEPIAFLHIDTDLYSSASDAFHILEDRIQPGTIIVFDELYNFAGFEEHEWKAFQEFLKRTGYRVEYLAFNIYHQQVAVRVLD